MAEGSRSTGSLSCGRMTSGKFAGAVHTEVWYEPGVRARVFYLQQYQLLPYQRKAEAMSSSSDVTSQP